MKVAPAFTKYGFVTALSISVGLVLTLIPFTAVTAQGSTAKPAPKGITVSPPLREVVLGPGLVEAKSTVSYKNNTDQDITLQLRTVDFRAVNDFGGIEFSELGKSTDKYGLAKWLILKQNTIRVQQGKTVTVEVGIDNAADLSPGGHYGGIIATVTGKSSQAKGKNLVNLKQELVSLFFVKKTGGERYGLTLDKLSPNPANKVPKDVTLAFKNTGNVHVVPRGYVEVTDPKGKLVAKAIINPESSIVLPEKTRQYVSEFQKVSDSKATGMYKITAHYRYDGKDTFEIKSSTFTVKRTALQTVLPFAILLIIIALITAAAFFGRKKFMQLRAKKRG